RTRSLYEEIAEERELLAGRNAGVDGQAARRKPIDLAAADRAEVAGAQEAHELVLIIGTVQRGVEADTGEAQRIRHHLVELVLAVVEQRGFVEHFARDAV